MNAEDFKKFSIVSMRSPATWGVLATIILIAILLGLIRGSIFDARILADPAVLVMGFIVVMVLPGFLISTLVRNFKPKWAYLIALLGQVSFVVVMMLSRASTRIDFVDSLVFWTVVTYTSWIFSLSGLAAIRIGPKMIGLSLVQPALVWLFIYSSIEVLRESTIPFMIMAGGVAASTLTLWFNDHLFSLVFAGISGMAELSKFLQGVRGEQVSLSIGNKINPLLQYMKFKTEDCESVIAAPWLHSGPIRGVGGGNLSTRCIELLNREYRNSYVLHIPSSHEYNPSQHVAPQVMTEIMQNKGISFDELKASPVVIRRGGGFVVQGQRLNEVYLISLSNPWVDDYDVGIFAALRERYKDKTVMFVDSHPNAPLKKCFNVEQFSTEAEYVERLIDEVVRELSTLPLVKARVGIAIRFLPNYSIFALVLKVNTSGRDETVLYFIADTNGFSEDEIEGIKELSKDLCIDHALFFTTDTHALSVKSLIYREDIPREDILSVVKSALDSVKAAKFAYGEALLKDVRVLGETYHELVAVVKIMTRVTPILFFLLFLILLILLWIF